MTPPTASRSLAAVGHRPTAGPGGAAGRRRRRVGIAAGLAALALVLAGCGSDDGAATTGTTPTADQLAGSTYTSSGWTGQPALVEGSTVGVAFTADSISITPGCNTANGGYTVEGGALVLSGPLAATKIACEEPLMAQDVWVTAFMESRPTITLAGDTLSLQGGAGTMTFAKS